MARDALTHPMVENYLQTLGRQLPGPRRARAAVLDELRDGLHEAMTAHRARGRSPSAAAADAIAEFGTSEEVARAFAGEMATVQARRVIWAFLLTGPLVGVWWLLQAIPQPWQVDPGRILAAIPVLPMVIAVLLIGLVTLAITGSMTRWSSLATPPRAVAAASMVALLCLAGDSTLLTLTITRIPTPTPITATLACAVTASVFRIAACCWVLRRCRTIRLGIGDGGP